jgi:hypothetical protein
MGLSSDRSEVVRDLIVSRRAFVTPLKSCFIECIDVERRRPFEADRQQQLANEFVRCANRKSIDGAPHGGASGKQIVRDDANRREKERSSLIRRAGLFGGDNRDLKLFALERETEARR